MPTIFNNPCEATDCPSCGTVGSVDVNVYLEVNGDISPTHTVLKRCKFCKHQDFSRESTEQVLKTYVPLDGWKM